MGDRKTHPKKGTQAEMNVYTLYIDICLSWFLEIYAKQMSTTKLIFQLVCFFCIIYVVCVFRYIHLIYNFIDF